MAKTSGGASQSESGFLSFLAGLFAGLTGGGGGDREKKRRLREIAKELRKRSRFYRVNGDLALPGLAKWFHDIYKAAGPADALLEKYGSSEVLKNVMIESLMPPEMRSVIAGLAPDSIRAEIEKGASIKAVSERVKEDLITFYSALNPSAVKKINVMYNDFHRFQAFCAFPYYFLLKKFDSTLPERNFTYNPRFEAINAQYIKDDIADFLGLLHVLNGDSDWDRLFDVLKSYRDIDVVSRSAWRKVLQSRRDMLKMRTLELIVRRLDENPAWVPVPENTNYEIVETYFNRIKTSAELTIQEIMRGRKKKQVESLLMKLFGTAAVSRTHYYTERENLTFHKKMLPGYTFVEPVNCLKAFFLDFYKSQVRVLVDLLLIRGKWVTKLSSQQFSEAYHQLLTLSDQLNAFDEALSDEGSKGARVKRFLRQSARDRSALGALKTLLRELNAEAKKLINESARNLILLGKSVKQLLGEYNAQGHEIIINWKEIEAATETPLSDRMQEVYTRIYYLVQLLQLHMKDAKPGG